MAIIKNISLDPEADRDILRWFADQRNQSAAVREAIRCYIARGDDSSGVTMADLLAEIRALPSRLRVVAVDAEAADSGPEPPEAAANLDSLLDRLAAIE